MPSYDLSKLNCMIVEDHQHMRRLLREVLRAIGVRKIEEAADGSAALEKIDYTAFDLVICDYCMEPMDGLSFTRAVRTLTDPTHRRTPIILLSSHTSRSAIFAARDAGVNEVATKPVSVAELYLRIYAIIERPRKFVTSETYIGPDRRRSVLDDTGERRRWNDSDDADVFDLEL